MDALPAAATGICNIVAAERVELATRDIRVRDVAELSCMASARRAELGALVVAQVPANRSQVAASRAALAALVRRRVPALSGMTMERGAITIVATEPNASAAPTRSCFAARGPIRSGEAISQALLAPAACAQSPQTRFLSYDRTEGVVRAGVDVPAGAYIGTILAPSELVADQNDQVSYRARNGAALVERFVTAVQPALGSRTFIRTRDGQVFSAPSSALTASGASP